MSSLLSGRIDSVRSDEVWFRNSHANLIEGASRRKILFMLGSWGGAATLFTVLAVVSPSSIASAWAPVCWFGFAVGAIVGLVTWGLITVRAVSFGLTSFCWKR